MMDAVILRHHIGKRREGTLYYVVITLMGRFKGETGSRNHLQSVANEIASKLKVKWWMERLKMSCSEKDIETVLHAVTRRKTWLRLNSTRRRLLIS